MEVMISDSPIETKKDDLLGRHRLAEKIANSIKKINGNESMAIGIESEWGSGKTSFVNLILESLKGSGLLIIKLNPWNFSNQDELIKDFFNSIVHEIGREEGGFAKDDVRILEQYSNKLLKGGETRLKSGFNCGIFFLSISANFKKNDVHQRTKKKKLIKSLKESTNGWLS